MRSSRGQATIEYVGAILLVVAILIAATVAIADPGIPKTVVAKLRLGLCIVGGDVCTTADAKARGLEPCLLSAEDHETANGVSVVILHAGGSDTWSAQRLSDGSVILTEGYGQSVGRSFGIGPELGSLKAGGSASLNVGFHSGRSWRMSEPELQRLMAQTKGKPDKYRLFLEALLGKPDESYLEGAGDGSAELAIEAVKSVPGAGVDAQAVLGRRKGRDGTTYYVDLGAGTGGPITDVIPEADRSGHVLAEYRSSDPPVLTLRASTRDHGGDERETVMRLALKDPDDRALARRVAFLRLKDPLALRDLANRIHDHGTVERLRYSTTEDEDGWAYGAKLGLELGIDHKASVLRRKLVDAQITNGPFPARRADCVGYA